jgi:hypothetical protein
MILFILYKTGEQEGSTGPSGSGEEVEKGLRRVNMI